MRFSPNHTGTFSVIFTRKATSANIISRRISGNITKAMDYAGEEALRPVMVDTKRRLNNPYPRTMMEKLHQSGKFGKFGNHYYSDINRPYKRTGDLITGLKMVKESSTRNSRVRFISDASARRARPRGVLYGKYLNEGYMAGFKSEDRVFVKYSWWTPAVDEHGRPTQLAYRYRAALIKHINGG